MTSNSFHKFAIIAAILCLTVVTSKPIQMFDQILLKITVSSSPHWPNTEADNERMTLHCELTPDTDEDVRYSWFKDDTQIGNEEYLVVEPFTRRDFGEYVCKADVFFKRLGYVTLKTSKTFWYSQKQTPWKDIDNSASSREEKYDIDYSISPKEEENYIDYPASNYAEEKKISERERDNQNLNRVQVLLKSNPSKVEFGKRAELEAVLSEPTDDVEIFWYKDGQFVQTGDILVIERFKESDKGVYKCEAKIRGEDGPWASMDYSRVSERNTKVRRNQDLNRVQVSLKSNPSKVKFGKRAELEAVLSELTDDVELFWYKYGQFVQTGDILGIQRFEESDRGVYKAKIRGEDGPWASVDYSGVDNNAAKYNSDSEERRSPNNKRINRSAVNVHIESTPSRLTRPGQRLELQCLLSRDLDEDEESQFRWTKDGEWLADGSLLVVPRYEASDAGRYDCFVTLRSADGSTRQVSAWASFSWWQ